MTSSGGCVFKTWIFFTALSQFTGLNLEGHCCLAVNNITGENSTDAANNCLAYQPGEPEPKFIWTLCNTSYLYLCENKSGGALSYPQEPSENTGDWGNRINKCFTDKMVPVDYETNLTEIDGKTGLWTGVIRSYSIYEDSDTSNRASFMPGYVIYTDSSWDLLFDRNTESLHALCNEGGDINEGCPTDSTTPDPEESTRTTQDPANTVTAESTQPPNDTPTAEVSASLGPNNTIAPTTSVNASAKANKLVGVYVAVPLAIVAAAVVIAFFIWRKRRNSADKDSKQNSIDNSYIDSREIPMPAKTGNAYEQEPDTVRHDYFILEPEDQYAAIKDGELNDKDDGEYDTTKGDTMNLSDTGNIYNRIDGEPEDTYNHTNTNTFGSDDTYNHTNTVNTRDDGDTYNHVSDGNTTYNTTETLLHSRKDQAAAASESDYNKLRNVDDTYNHLSGDLPNQDMSTNADNTFNHQGTEMGDPKQVAHEYSHVQPSSNNPPSTLEPKNMKYDYAYATNAASSGSTKPAMFKLNQLPNAGSHEFAKEPPSNVTYELAKPPGV